MGLIGSLLRPFPGLKEKISMAIKVARLKIQTSRSMMVWNRFKNPVVLSELNRTDPVSSMFGVDRGTGIQEYYISNFLEQHREHVRGRTLEVQEDRYTSRFASGQISVDILHVTDDNPAATIVGDLTQPETLPANEIDCFICTNVLNFIYDTPAAVRGISHLLKSGGVFLGTVAAITQISRFDMDRWGDYWRFTEASVNQVFKNEFEGEFEIFHYGNALAATAVIQGMAVEDLPDPKLLDVKHFDYPVTIGILARKVEK